MYRFSFGLSGQSQHFLCAQHISCFQNQLESHPQWQEEYRHRLIPVIGDLSKPLLGLSEPQFNELSEKIEVIYHNGAWVNHIYPYEPILLKWHWEFDELKRAPGFQHYVRSIPHYHNALTAAGFTVSKILEPKSTIDTPHTGFSREILREYKYIAEHIPITFIIVCRKP